MSSENCDFDFQMLLQEKADALKEEAEDLITAPEEANGVDTETNVWRLKCLFINRNGTLNCSVDKFVLYWDVNPFTLLAQHNGTLNCSVDKFVLYWDLSASWVIRTTWRKFKGFYESSKQWNVFMMCNFGRFYLTKQKICALRKGRIKMERIAIVEIISFILKQSFYHTKVQTYGEKTALFRKSKE